MKNIQSRGCDEFQLKIREIVLPSELGLCKVCECGVGKGRLRRRGCLYPRSGEQTCS